MATTPKHRQVLIAQQARDIALARLSLLYPQAFRTLYTEALGEVSKADCRRVRAQREQQALVETVHVHPAASPVHVDTIRAADPDGDYSPHVTAY